MMLQVVVRATPSLRQPRPLAVSLLCPSRRSATRLLLLADNFVPTSMSFSGAGFPPGGPTGRVPVLSIICRMKERVQVTIDGAMGVRQREKRWSP